MVHARRGAAAARAFRRRRVARQGIPPLPPPCPAGEDRGDRQFQGRRRQDLDRGASRHVGRARRLPGAGGRSRQPGLDDLDLRRNRRLGMGHGLSADRAGLCAGAAGREPAAGRARREPPALRGHAGRGAEPARRRRDPADPLAEHRPDRRAAQPLLGGVPDPGLAHGAEGLEALGRARTPSSATGCWRPTT
jgi:hypothetical protein